MAETSLLLATEVRLHTPILPYSHTFILSILSYLHSSILSHLQSSVISFYHSSILQCWEKLKGQFSSATREEAVVKTFFKLLCFHAEAVSIVTHSESN